jgi:hypothetical protein
MKLEKNSTKLHTESKLDNATSCVVFSKVTKVQGNTTFTLPQGSYRFRADKGGT